MPRAKIFPRAKVSSAPAVEVVHENGQERRRDWSLNIVTDDFLSGTLLAVGKNGWFV